MNRPWVAIQRNPTSGSGPRNAVLRDLIEGLRRNDLRPRLFSRREAFRERLEIEGRRDGLVGIVAAGGDGTVGDVINRFPGVPVAVLPLGTENLLARCLGVPRSGSAVADMIAAGVTRRLDLGVLTPSLHQPDAQAREDGGWSMEDGKGNDRHPSPETRHPAARRFTLMTSAGFDAEVVRRTHGRRTGHISKLSYLQPFLASLRIYRHPAVHVYVDDESTPLTASLVLAANLPAYAFKLPAAAGATADDGLLDLRLFQPATAFQMMHTMYKVARGAHEAMPDVVCLRAARVRIEAVDEHERIPVQVDGDPAGFTPVEIQTLPGALEIFVP